MKSPPAEKKFLDTADDFGATQIPTTGAIGNSINLLTNGTGAQQLIGRKITIKSIQSRCFVTFTGVTGAANPNAAINNDIVRMLLVQDTQTNGAYAIPSDILAISGSINSLINMENSGRFKILKEKVIEFNNTVPGILATGPTYYTGSARKSFKWFKKCNIDIMYDNAASSNITDIRDNNIFWLAISNRAVATVNMNTRIRYTDA